MFEIEKLNWNFKKDYFSFLYLLWWVFIPIGSNFVIFNISFLSIYPSLFLSITLITLGIKTTFSWKKETLISAVFLILWLLQCFIQLFQNEITELARFDFKSIVLQAITFMVILVAHTRLEKAKSISIIVYGLRFYLFVLIFSGFFEAFTGIHPIGNFTDKLIHLRVGNIHYAPVFLYDNPNDFIAHYLFLLIALIWMDKKTGNNYYLMLLLLLVGYYFSELADARLGKIAFITCAAFYLFSLIKLVGRTTKWMIVGAMCSFIFLFLYKPIFIGPKYKNSANYRLNEVIHIQDSNSHYSIALVEIYYTKKQQEKLIKTMDSIAKNNPNNSDNVRKSLLLNGFSFIKEAPIFGIGPGQFYQRHFDKKVENYTGTVANAHCFPMEIISVYGIMGWIYFSCMIFLIIGILRKNKWEYNSKFLMSFILLGIVWLLPSSYIYLEIYRLTLPLLLVLYLSTNINNVNIQNESN